MAERNGQKDNKAPELEPLPRPLTPGRYARRVVVTVLITLLLVSLAALVWVGVHVLLEAFAGMMFAVFLSALSVWVSRWTRLSYRWSLVVVVVALIALASGLGWLLWSRLAAQVTEMVRQLPQAFEHLRTLLSQYPWGKHLLEQMPEATGSLTSISSFTKFTGLVSGVAGFVIGAVVILFIGIFGAAEPDVYRQGLLHLVPPRHRQRTREALAALAVNLRWWLLGQVALMICIGCATALGLWLMGMPLALTLGLIAGIMELVPYIGPWISAIPALLLALLISPWHLLGVAILYLAIHVLEGYVLMPLLQRSAVNLPPALTLVAQVLLGELLGIIGLFTAAPLTVSAVVLLKMLYVEDTLGDQDIKVLGEPPCQEKADIHKEEARQAEGSK